jgi:hypothetical protein
MRENTIEIEGIVESHLFIVYGQAKEKDPKIS